MRILEIFAKSKCGLNPTNATPTLDASSLHAYCVFLSRHGLEELVRSGNESRDMGLYVVIMSRTSFNLHSIVCLNVKELLARSRDHI